MYGGVGICTPANLTIVLSCPQEYNHGDSDDKIRSHLHGQAKIKSPLFDANKS